MELNISTFSFGILFLFGVMASGVECAGNDTDNSFPMLVTINNELVRLFDNCTVGDRTTCDPDHCCTKKHLTYEHGFSGSRPVYQIQCEPLRQTGEFCYYTTPENFCPCATRCHTNGFYGACL